MTVLDEFETRLQERYGEVRDELEQIERVLDVIGAKPRQRGRPPRGKRPGRPRSSRNGRKAQGRGRAKRMSSAEREKALMAFAKANPTASNDEIAKALKIGKAYAGNLLGKSKRVKRENGKLVVSK